MDTYLAGHPATQGIRFNDCFFSEPAPFTGWARPKYAGLYAVLVSDPNWAPKPYQPLYFGEFGNNSPADLGDGATAHALGLAANGRTLLVCVYPMPFSTSAQRWALRQELISAYNPAALQSPKDERPREPRRRIGFVPQIDEPAA